MEKKVINGWHVSCKEDLPAIDEIVLAILQDLDEDGNPIATEEPQICFNWRSDDDEYEVDELGWCKLYENSRVAYWFPVPNLPKEFNETFLTDAKEK